MFLLLSQLATIAAAAGPSFDCKKAEVGSVEEMICKDPELSALDGKMAEVYKAAAEKATNEHPLVLKTEQRDWIKERNECWKNNDRRGCVEPEYRRIAELPTRYRLITGKGPFSSPVTTPSAG